MTITRQLVLLVLAILSAVAFTLIGFNVLHWDHEIGWGGLVVAFFLASKLP